MNLLLAREKSTEKFTPGKLYLNSEFFCYTCEDVVREKKIYGETAIPAGIYKIILSMSQRFKKELPLLVDVPGFGGIRIHAGNTADDTLGCILPGLARAGAGVMHSQAAMDKLMPLMRGATVKGEGITITIRDAANA